MKRLSLSGYQASNELALPMLSSTSGRVVTEKSIFPKTRPGPYRPRRPRRAPLPEEAEPQVFTSKGVPPNSIAEGRRVPATGPGHDPEAGDEQRPVYCFRDRATSHDQSRSDPSTG